MKVNITRKSILTTILLFFTALACDIESNCIDVICFTPPEALRLRVIGKQDSTDLIFNGFFDIRFISLYYFNNTGKVTVDTEIQTDTINEISIIYSDEISWKSVEGIKDYFLFLNSIDNDTLYLNVESISENCCRYHPYVDFTINGEEVEFENGYYTLKKDYCTTFDLVQCYEAPPFGEICAAYFERWFYDHDLKACRIIGYGGCVRHGFETQGECEECVCKD